MHKNRHADYTRNLGPPCTTQHKATCPQLRRLPDTLRAALQHAQPRSRSLAGSKGRPQEAQPCGNDLADSDKRSQQVQPCTMALSAEKGRGSHVLLSRTDMAGSKRSGTMSSAGAGMQE